MKGFKTSLKEAVTGMERSLLDVEVKEFIQMMMGVRNNLPNLSIGPAKFRSPTTASSWRRATNSKSTIRPHLAATLATCSGGKANDRDCRFNYTPW